MNREYKLYQINSFTDRLFTGNPAGVVSNADGLTEDEMLLIARELNNSETAFIFTQTAAHGKYDVEVRFFTPKIEVPICGHATIAAHFVLGLENRIHLGKSIKQKTKAGILPVRLIATENGSAIEMTQGDIEFTKIPLNDQQAIVEALGLRVEDLVSNYPIEIASTGHSKVMIGLKSKNRLDELRPDFSKLAEISSAIQCNGYFPFVLSGEKNVTSYGRMFAPAIGINEDPVTGNANGPLGAYLIKNRLVSCNGKKFRFTAKQGQGLNRPGMMKVIVDIQNGQPASISIIGRAVKVFETSIIL